LLQAVTRLIGKSLYCGQGKGLDFYATSGEASIKMKADPAKTARKQFHIEYSLSRKHSRSQGAYRTYYYFGNYSCSPPVGSTLAHCSWIMSTKREEYIRML